MTISAPALGADDRTARSRRTAGRKGSRRAPAPHAYLGDALLRCLLYLGPLSVAVTAAGPLRGVARAVPALVLVVGWSAAQALTSLGVSMARRAGRPAATRLVGGGFAALAGFWCAYVWVAPVSLLGPDRWLALNVGIGGFAVLATVTAALVTRSEAAVIRWSLPCWLLGAFSVAVRLGDDWARLVPVRTLLPAAITVAVIRAYRSVIGRSLPKRPPMSRADFGRGTGYLIIGAAQATCVVMLWRAGTLAVLPLLVAVPVLETLVCWHIRQVARGRYGARSEDALRRHVRAVTVVTVAGLLPPLIAAGALVVAFYRLSPGRAGDTTLALAAGTLLGGVFAGTFLLAARHRTAPAATLAAVPPLALAALPSLPPSSIDRLPAIVAVLAATHLIGLLAVALTAADHRRSL